MSNSELFFRLLGLGLCSISSLGIVTCGLAAGAIGSARAALEVATRYSTKRKAFGRPIHKFQAVNFSIADSIAALYLDTEVADD